jgi:hypothetical protein
MFASVSVSVWACVVNFTKQGQVAGVSREERGESSEQRAEIREERAVEDLGQVVQPHHVLIVDAGQQIRALGYSC